MKDCTISNINLIDGLGNAPNSRSSLVVKNGKINKVSLAHSFKACEDSNVIDGKGLWLMPGMFDLHMHFNNMPYAPVRALRQTLHSGFTTIACVGSMTTNTDGTTRGMMGVESVALRNAIKDDTFPDCSRLLAGAVVAATNGHVKGRFADGPWAIRREIRKASSEAIDFIKTAATGGFWAEHEECWWTDYCEEELIALVDEAHSFGLPVVVHAHSQPGLQNCINAGTDVIHHGCFIDDRALEGMLARNLDFVPTLRVTCEKNIRIKEKANRPWESRKMAEAHNIHREGVRKAFKMGIRIGLGTDLPGTPPWSVAESAVELVELTQCGLTPIEAIKVATYNSAAIMGLEKDLGSIEQGKSADLVLVRKNPLQSIDVLTDPSNIVMVMKEGKLIRDELASIKEIKEN